MRRALVAAGIVAALAATAAFATDDAPVPARQRELVHLLRQDCGSCHGLTLKGGLGPALTPDALRSRSSESLAVTILAGRPGTPMPPWSRFISAPEARWLVERMLAGQIDASR